MLMYGTKIVFFLMLMICVPLFFETSYLMQLWLKDVPEHTVMFVRLVIIDVLIDSISYPLMSVVQATGKIKLYQTVVGGILIMNLPISCLFLHFGFASEIVFVIAIVLSLIALFSRIIIAQKLIEFNLLFPFIKLLFHFVLITIVTILLPVLTSHKNENDFFSFILYSFIYLIWCGFVEIFIGFNREEQKKIFTYLKQGKIYGK